jgi:hypothetical protein
MRKSIFRPTCSDSHAWASSEAEMNQDRNVPVHCQVPSAVGEWLPESALRDALIAERLPAAVGGQNLFWINIRQYLSHDDAQLPPEEYLRHWREIYRSCLNQETSRLSALSYVSVEGPMDGSDLN